ncbi:hypothetical protein D5085_15830 [Ectothiorhodospiraceae bacterium BW-2]|nr:hypothetical protein D5085_15830 [Ectothiorhodospiraceae bacterium BW-2]
MKHPIALVILLGLLLKSVQAAEPFTLEFSDNNRIELNQGELSAYLDRSSELSFKQIQQRQAEGKFQTLSGNLSVGYVPHVYWLHFSLRQPEQIDKPVWMEVIPPYLDSIQLYHLNEHGALSKRSGGDFVPQSRKEVDYRATVFKLLIEPGTHHFYLRLQTSSTMVASIRLWQPDDFSGYSRDSYFLFGLFWSLMMTVLLFNAANYLLSRRTVFLIYVVYLGLNSVQWMAINGFASEYLFPENPLYANLLLGISISLSAASAYLFFAVLYEYRKYHPFIYRVNQFGATVSLITAIATPLGYYQLFAPIMLFTAIFSLGTFLWPMWRLWQTGYLWNRMLVVSHMAYVLLISMNILGVLALIPFDESVTFTGMLSHLFHILTLHFAMMLHYQKLEQDHKRTMEEALNAQRQIAIEKIYREEQSQLLSMLTHEIKTPIAVIDAANASLKLLDEKIEHSAEDRSKRYDRIQNAVKRMNGVMEMALQKKHQEEFLPLELGEMDLVELTYEVVELNRIHALDRVDVRCEQPVMPIWADQRLIRIVLINLLDNAHKYSTPKSQIDIAISHQSNNSRAGIVWQITNAGEPIPEQSQATIFHKYQRGSEIHNQPGMGLGLYLVAGIAQKHQGTVTVENLPSAKIRFSVWLPGK